MKRGVVLAAIALVLWGCASFADESKVTVEANIVSDKPALNYVVEVPYRLAVNVTNGEGVDIAIKKIDVSISQPKGLVIEAKLQGDPPTVIPKDGSISLTYDFAFPKEAAGKEVTLVARVDYKRGKRNGYSGLRLTQYVASQIELNLLPKRSVLHPHHGSRQAISIINNTDEPLVGKVSIVPYAGIEVNPASIEANVEPRGLEVYTYEVTAAKGIAPGHYAITVDVAGRAKDWVAVEVPLVIKRAPKLVIDGNLDDWKNTARITMKPPSPDGKPGQPTQPALGYLAYDADNLYFAFDVPDLEHVDGNSSKTLSAGDCIVMGFDPQFNGAASSAGGYREDDYEYVIGTVRGKPMVARNQAPKGTALGPVGNSVKVAFNHEGKRSRYEIALPWSELKPFKPAKEAYFGLGILISDTGQSGTISLEWVGGMGKVKDPRLFLPVLPLD